MRASPVSFVGSKVWGAVVHKRLPFVRWAIHEPRYEYELKEKRRVFCWKSINQ